jgi:hypothetical protein
MLEVNSRDGFGISVSENTPYQTQVAKRTVPTDGAFSVVLPMIEQVFGWPSAEIRTLFQSFGLPLHEWERIRRDLIAVG